jgi:hypothetical protein
VLTLDGIIAHDVIEGLVNTKHFLSFLEKHVVSDFGFTCCSRLILTYSGLHSILVLDNCSIHHAEKI